MENFDQQMRELYQRKQIEIALACEKERALNLQRLELEEQKFFKQEYRHEMRKRQYSEIRIAEDGEVEVETKNSLISLPKHRTANFKVLDILKLESTEGDGPVYVLFLQINEYEKQVYINGEKVGRGRYLLKKITEAGGRIFIDSQNKKADFIGNLWTIICNLAYGKILIPVHRGWLKIDEKEYRFVKEEEILWGDVIKRAK